MEGEVAVTYDITTSGNFKWTDANTADLIVWRVTNSGLFTGKKNSAIKAFEQFVKEKQLEGKVSAAWVKKKWENLRQKYKDLKSLNLVGGDPTVGLWKWYAIMDQALSGELSVSPTYISSLSNNIGSFSSSVLVSSSALDTPPVKRRKEQYWLVALQEMEKRQEERDRREADREEERERRATQREEERDRRAMEREEERERQAQDRERRREQELMTRQERWEREMLEREEKREKEYKEREEQRDREAAAREDRLFKILETFLAKEQNTH